MATILIIDDNKKNLQVLGNVLYEKGYKVAMAIDGPSALKLTDKLIPDLILLDIMMPGMDGFEVCTILKSKEETREIPIIFLTAKVDLEDIIRGFKVGGSDYVTKPFKKEELLARINTQIELIEGRKKIMQQAKELAEINALKDKIFGVIANDVKNALANFIQVPSLISDPRLNMTSDELKATMDDLQSKAKETYHLMENVLWWSRAQQKKISPKLCRVNAQELFRQIEEKQNDYLTGKKVKLSIICNDDDHIIADETMLVLVVNNLVNNAIKFSSKGKVVHLVCSPKTDTTIIEIIDHGAGIQPDVLAKINSPLSYPIEFGTANEHGSGIGMMVSRDLLAIMNAHFEIESTLNEGTTIKLYFQNEFKTE